MDAHAEQMTELALTAIGLVRCRLEDDEAGFRALCEGTDDPWLLIVVLAKLGAEVIEATTEDWPRALSMMAAFAVSQTQES